MTRIEARIEGQDAMRLGESEKSSKERAWFRWKMRTKAPLQKQPASSSVGKEFTWPYQQVRTRKPATSPSR